MSELINVILIRLNYKLIIFSGCVDNHNINTTTTDNHNINTMYSISQSRVCTCDCGLWSIPYRACSLQFSFIEQVLTSVSAVFWFLLSEIQCRSDFWYETKFYIRKRLRSNSFVKLWKHLTGLWGAVLILFTREESSMAP